MDIKPAEADVPTPDMLAKIGMTTNMIVSASTAKSGTMIRARFSLTAAEPLTFLNFFSMLLSGNLETPMSGLLAVPRGIITLKGFLPP